jgi:hypothetical protein
MTSKMEQKDLEMKITSLEREIIRLMTGKFLSGRSFFKFLTHIFCLFGKKQ